MSSEFLASGENVLDSNLGGAWDITNGYAGRKRDLGIARRFGGAAAAYSLRDIGAMNGPVVRVRRSPHDTSTTEIQDEEDFSANQLSSGALEDWVNGKLETSLPADVNYALGLESARYFNGTNSGVVTSSISGLVNATGSIETSFAFYAKNKAIISFEDNSDTDDNLTIQTDASGYLTILHRTNGVINILAKLQTLILDDGTLHTVRWNMSSSGSQVILDGKDVTSDLTFTVGNSSTQKWVSDLNDPDVLSIGYRAEASPDGFATGVIVNTTIFGTNNITPLANYLGYGSSNYWNDTIGSLNATESNITQTWEQAQGAAAAYSLRKVKASYSGDAVRIRRTSDSVEVNVAFDSDDKVSASSAIANTTEEGGESGETNATTVAEFLSEERTTFVTNPNFSAVSNVTLDSQTITNTTASVTFSGATGNGFIRDNSKPANIGAETGDTVSFDVTASGLNSQAGIRIRVVGANTDIISPAVNDIDNGTQNVSFTVGANSPAGYFAFTNLSTASSATITVSNLKVVGKSATVHTWYDQAGSNDAVQATAANQPKIAESGALLSDGLKFNGNSDEFTITNGVSGRSIFAATNQNIDTTAGGGSGAGQDGLSALLGTTASDSYIFVTNNNPVFNSYAISLDGPSGDVGQFAANGGTLSSVGGDLGTYGDIPSDTNSLISIIYGAGDPANAWTRLGSAAGVLFMQGSISEVILYSTDQTANRFKIESNINNYYGLYNDANELSGNFTVDSSGTGTNASISNESKTGFTATVVDKAGFFGADLNESVPNSSNLYISFTANLSPSGGTAATPNFGLANSSDKTGNSTGNPLDTAVVEGFNSITVAGTASTCDRIRFTEGNDNVSFTISDIKVSRIARNGFVETWYDQSGNGRDATQLTAGSQPKIVDNGSYLGKITLDNTDDFLNTTFTPDITNGFANIVLELTALYNFNTIFDNDADANHWEMWSYATGQIATRSTDGDFRLNATSNISAGAKHLHTLSYNSSRADLFRDGVSVASDTSRGTAPTASTLNIGAGNAGNTPTNGSYYEFIWYSLDQTSDRTDIERDILDFYNI